MHVLKERRNNRHLGRKTVWQAVVTLHLIHFFARGFLTRFLPFLATIVSLAVLAGHTALESLHCSTKVVEPHSSRFTHIPIYGQGTWDSLWSELSVLPRRRRLRH